MTYELKGKVKLVMDAQTYDSGFKKREFVVTTADDKYPQDVKFEMVKGANSEKDPTTYLDKVKSGDEVTVHFDIRGNEYKDRNYVNLACWRVEIGIQSANQPAAPASAGDESEDLPPF